MTEIVEQKKNIWNLSAYYIYNVLSRLCKITIINMPVILAIISVTGNVHHTAFKPIK